MVLFPFPFPLFPLSAFSSCPLRSVSGALEGARSPRAVELANALFGHAVGKVLYYYSMLSFIILHVLVV